MSTGRPTRRDFARFFAKVSVDASGCWVWTGAVLTAGYGVFKFSGLTSAHRIAYTWFVGPIPDGLQLDHLCRRRACANPAHCEPVTPAENTRRAFWPGGICRRGHVVAEVGILQWVFNGKRFRRCRACHNFQNRQWAAANKSRLDGEQKQALNNLRAASGEFDKAMSR